MSPFPQADSAPGKATASFLQSFKPGDFTHREVFGLVAFRRLFRLIFGALRLHPKNFTTCCIDANLLGVF